MTQAENFLADLIVLFDASPDVKAQTIARKLGAIMVSHGTIRDGEPGYTFQFSDNSKVFCARHGGMAQMV